MAKGILGKKIGMTQIFEADGRLIPVTVVEASGNKSPLFSMVQRY